MKITCRAAWKAVFFLVIAGMLFPLTATGAMDDSSEPIHIEADRMVSTENTSSVVFIGNVDARQGDLLIRTDKMTVFYVEDEKGSGTGTSAVEKLICVGNVEISEGNWLGTGERMDYFARERKVILSGDAKGWQGQNMVSGKTITYYLDEGRSVVEAPVTAEGEADKKDAGKGGRVKAVIHPEADSK
jgi:lipopolysaccharide export system protein LptA